jgi:hypothetical protein
MMEGTVSPGENEAEFTIEMQNEVEVDDITSIQNLCRIRASNQKSDADFTAIYDKTPADLPEETREFLASTYDLIKSNLDAASEQTGRRLNAALRICMDMDVRACEWLFVAFIDHANSIHWHRFFSLTMYSMAPAKLTDYIDQMFSRRIALDERLLSLLMTYFLNHDKVVEAENILLQLKGLSLLPDPGALTRLLRVYSRQGTKSAALKALVIHDMYITRYPHIYQVPSILREVFFIYASASLGSVAFQLLSSPAATSLQNQRVFSALINATRSSHNTALSHAIIDQLIQASQSLPTAQPRSFTGYAWLD